MIAILICATIIILISLYLGYLRLKAKQAVDNAPRADMFLCEQHGPISSKSLFYLDIGADKKMPYCPRCLEQRFKEAKAKN
jgi:hypothetical protein